MSASETENTLKERGGKYGDFSDNAAIAQGLKEVVRAHAGWDALYDFQKEALELIFMKISRIVSGDKTYLDSALDISGYAMLMHKKQRELNEKRTMNERAILDYAMSLGQKIKAEENGSD